MIYSHEIKISPEHITGLKDICKKFKKSKRAILDWKAQGAPIFFDGKRYCTEYNTLFNWLVKTK